MDDIVICRVCAQGWTGARPGDRCPTGDGGVLVAQAVHEKLFSDSVIGTAVAGKYAIIGKLGEGGFGSVYRAVQEPVGRTVAVKVIASGEANDEELRGRFFREARVVSRLSNRSIVTLHDYGEDDDGTLFMVFEFIDGISLADLIAKGPMDPHRAVNIVVQMLGALTEAHELGLIHRDLKPGNVMITTGPMGAEEVKVLDFGIAKMENPDDMDDVRTREGVVLGTPRYMSPEQSQDAVLDGRSDLYAIGIILYELLVGHPPFTGAVPFDILLAHIQSPVPPMPPSLGVPAALEAAVRGALAKQPSERPTDAKAMIAQLREALGVPGVTSSNSMPVPRIPSGTFTPAPRPQAAPADVSTADVVPPRRGNRGLLAIVLAVLLGGGGFAAWWLTRTPTPTPAPTPPTGPTEPVSVQIGVVDPAAELRTTVRLATAGQQEDAVLSMRRALENTADKAKLIAWARTQKALAPVLADPGLAGLLK